MVLLLVERFLVGYLCIGIRGARGFVGLDADRRTGGSRPCNIEMEVQVLVVMIIVWS